MKRSPKIAALAQNGRKGGQKRAFVYDEEQRSEWASQGGQAVVERYGSQYFSHLAKQRWRKVKR